MFIDLADSYVAETMASIGFSIFQTGGSKLLVADPPSAG